MVRERLQFEYYLTLKVFRHLSPDVISGAAFYVMIMRMEGFPL